MKFMKTQLVQTSQPRPIRISIGLIAIMMLLLDGSALLQAQAPPSPVDTWDCVLSGSKQGTARIMFNADNTLDGLQIRYGRSGSTFPEVNPRGGASEDRTSGSSTNGGGGTNLYGGSILVGEWGYGVNGKSLVGYIEERSSSRTNQVSFTGSVRPGRSLTLKASTDGANHVIRGVPQGTTVDISGDYFALGKHQDGPFNESLNLSFAAPGEYDITGNGPGYTVNGFAMLLQQKQIGVYLERVVGTNLASIVAVSGSFKTNKLTGNVRGTDGMGPVRYQLVGQ